MSRFNGGLADSVAAEFSRRTQSFEAGSGAPAATSGSGGGSGIGGNMNERVTRLETHFEYIRRDLDEIKDTLKALPALATKRDFVTWAGIYLAIAAIIVGGVIGGLSWIRPGPQPVDVHVVAPMPPAPDTSAPFSARPESQQQSTSSQTPSGSSDETAPSDSSTDVSPTSGGASP